MTLIYKFLEQVVAKKYISGVINSLAGGGNALVAGGWTVVEVLRGLTLIFEFDAVTVRG